MLFLLYVTRPLRRGRLLCFVCGLLLRQSSFPRKRESSPRPSRKRAAGTHSSRLKFLIARKQEREASALADAAGNLYVAADFP